MSENYFVHKSAEVEEGAKIGKDTKIWNYSHVQKGAEIGENCILGQNTFIGSSAKIGNNVKVQNNVSVYDEVIIEDDCFIGPSAVFTNVINPRAFIERKSEFRRTTVKRGASIGANATVICGIEIGEYSFIGAGSVVTKNVKPYSLVYGNPAKNHGFVCKCGEKLEFSGEKAECKCNLAYGKSSEDSINPS